MFFTVELDFSNKGCQRKLGLVIHYKAHSVLLKYNKDQLITNGVISVEVTIKKNRRTTYSSILLKQPHNYFKLKRQQYSLLKPFLCLLNLAASQ